MSGPFISPRAPVDFPFEGVVFRLRPLTAEERLPILLSVKDGERVVFGAGALSCAIRTGLVGWSGDGAPPWSQSMGENLARLSDAAYIACARQVIDMSFISDGEKKSS